MNKLIILSFLFFNTIFSQESTSNLSISGSVKILIGSELVTDKGLFITLQPGNEIASIDRHGTYRFFDLKNGEYTITVLDYNQSPEKFKIILNNKSIKDFDLIINAECEVNSEVAELDLKNGNQRLFLIGGIAPVAYNREGKFEKKYGFKYYDFGCISPALECVIKYNERIFKHLDEKFGRKWREDIRQDVIGLK